ncbi:MAG: ABC transporter ATP-binding protein [Deltaproteobacteria bacterium]|nr:ABC transporter ATP-binding protein [Deltaproteobacteria bacterium]MBW1993287.1 ABC transporter ATP-binding protein [Deltaproteobacteria bacterium]MBW2154090.1 ABC transporter ATP-binding protein [Deltaproteobacteria bacterium]
MLKINNIEVKYHHAILVLRGVTMDVEEESVVALLGANGAGKTTTLKAISGLLKTEVGEVTDGTIELDGRRIDRLDTEEIVRLGITQAMEGRRIFEHLTVEENLRAGRKGSDIPKDLEMVYSYFPRLRALRRNVSGFLSGGEQQMMVIGSGLMAHPKYFLLDEPSLGLSPLLTEEIFGIIKRIRIEEKTAILLVEQNALIALDVADYGYVMENGKVVLDGPTDKLKDNEDIKEFYLGLSEIGERKSYKDVKHYRRRKRWLG